MTERCQFDPVTLTCPACGYVAKRLPTFRECRPPPPPPPWRPYKIGDAVERWLTAIGITTERVERWTRTAGKPGGCGCESRKKWMNEACDRVQYAVRNGLIHARDWYVGKTH